MIIDESNRLMLFSLQVVTLSEFWKNFAGVL